MGEENHNLPAASGDPAVLADCPAPEGVGNFMDFMAGVMAERERCAKIAESYYGRNAGIGPLFGAGVNDASKAIAQKIRSGE